MNHLLFVENIRVILNIFFDKSTHQDQTFEWENLFGCCSSTAHCGHYKDQILPDGTKRQYNPQQLIKPDIDDPELYLQFLPSGKIKEQDNLDEINIQKAITTIKALHLDNPSLELSREQQITRYQTKVSAIIHILDSSMDDEELKEAMREYDEIEKEALTAPHRTAIKQAVIWLND